MDKEFLYVGHYIDTEGNYVLKIGTTNDLDRRGKEHTRNYRRAKEHRLPPNAEFIYDWHIKLSKYNTIRYEDRNREKWKGEGIGNFIRNDRFICPNKPPAVVVTIRKEYRVVL